VAGRDAPIRKFVRDGVPFSAIIWGPPGCGKTTFARLVSAELAQPMEYVTAVSAGVPELRQIVARYGGRPFVLVVDEVHRFNRVQQDYLLPMLENRLMTFIGLTTESPYAVLSPALRSRIFMLRFSQLTSAQVAEVLVQGVGRQASSSTEMYSTVSRHSARVMHASRSMPWSGYPSLASWSMAQTSPNCSRKSRLPRTLSKSTMTWRRPLSSPCVAPTPMRPSTTWRG